MKNFIDALGVDPSIKDPMEIFFDNEGAVSLTKEPKDHDNSRHILRKYHYIRNRIEDGDIVVNRVSSKENLSDLFTNPLSRTKPENHTMSIGIRFTDDMV